MMRAPLVIALAAVLGLAVAPPAALAQSRGGAPDGFSHLAEAGRPAVVSSVPTQEQGAAAPGRPGPGGPLPPGMEEFFERFGEDFFDRFFDERPPPGPQRGLGSGFVIDPSGFVVTNAHVVEGAAEIEVVFDEGPRLAAEVVGTDARTDLALLQVETDEPLPALQWGESEGAAIGDWVVAIGNPFGLGGSVTAGVISARARDIRAGPYDEFLQTDAAINRGNSGGPLLDMNGRVIGVNTAIFSPTGGSIGIGFAIPASIARPVIDQLRDTGSVRRGWLGVQIQPITPEIGRALGLDEAQGALVSSVIEGTPAAEAGVEVGDVILRFADRAIEEVRDLTRAVAEAPVGEPAEMVLWRNGEQLSLAPRIALLEEEPQQQAEAQPVPESGPLGMSLSELTPEARAELGIDAEVEGVVVTDVAPGSPAFRQGMVPGDVIMRVGDRAVQSPEQVAEAIDTAREGGQEAVLVLRQREDQQSFVALPVEEGAG